MTPTTTDEQLRIRCAELMGYSKHSQVSDGSQIGHYWWQKDGKADNDIPNYPADMTAAFTLVDALAKDGWSIEIAQFEQGDWRVDFYKVDKVHTSHNPSLAVAVCKAFVKCKEGA